MPASSRSAAGDAGGHESDFAVVGLVDHPADGGDALHQPSDPFLAGAGPIVDQGGGQALDQTEHGGARRSDLSEAERGQRDETGATAQRVVRDQRQPRDVQGQVGQADRDVPPGGFAAFRHVVEQRGEAAVPAGGDRTPVTAHLPSHPVVDARAEQLRQLGGQQAGDLGRMVRRGGDEADHDDTLPPVGARLVLMTQILAHPRSSIAGAGRTEVSRRGHSASRRVRRVVRLLTSRRETCIWDSPSRAPIWVWVEISEEPQNDDRALPRRQVVQCSTELMAVLGDLQFPVDATQYVGR